LEEEALDEQLDTQGLAATVAMAAAMVTTVAMGGMAG